MVNGQRVSAWRPRVPGIVEVFHARFTAHAYPMHVHDVWTLLIVDDGAVRYDLDRREHGTPGDTVSLLPPQVPHNGSPATSRGFRKRVLYLAPTQLDARLIGAAVDAPDLVDPLLRRRVGQLHTALAEPGDAFEAQCRLAFISERLDAHLRPRVPTRARAQAPGVAAALRELLDERLVEGVTLDEAAGLLYAHPTHLVRAFSRAYGISPHQYLTARRLERARRLLLDGMPPGEVAAATGFHDQPHLNRSFKRLVGTTPGRFASGDDEQTGPLPERTS
ncbi:MULTISPECIES: AraC family transcriptional regulator [unclassified Streptomyces]|uniref:AraC family transcriptional regulator n=1 Tax=unclassified Streptomyces TaxID=2593676 RepID=UPI001CB7599B|nr:MULTISPECIES: AraC family transcriptional regulator [unclassified Streptomyces]MBD0708199.1 AraC family transcriptional regulator [Streptomyces sp. CBMA291]MBD0714491.1 AraC family transcriptional regulator [Streptomyces sp. CBMA370]